MKVFFDSNVWRKIAIPEDNTDDPQYVALCEIHDAIVDGRIEAYISESIFTLENIPRKERKGKVGSMKARIKSTVRESDDKVNMGFSIGPNPNDAVSLDDNEYLKSPTEAALKIGFRIVRLPRIGGLTNKDIEPVLYKPENLGAFLDKAMQVGREIESKSAGKSQLDAIVKNNPGISITDKIKNAPEGELNKIAHAIAEMVDGDAVATSIGLGCDYFCTRDEAKGAGTKSVLSTVNVSWLNAQYGFTVKKPEEIAALL